ncbi:A-kinase anchor protein 17A [Frankliniella fusca]|uniref:A-kinase anchor protein 17A n=1 Tax=Frankliniella fusca TaxID=407009 RepID=A0AAE1HME8_9NEOP|nr:A-kinase anchor protein 17A [Frankliniella fusca]
MSKIQLLNKSVSLSGSVSSTLNSAFQTCSDTSDAVELFVPQQLYLKPVAKLNISVQLPQLKLPGKTISNWEVMEKLKTMVKPIQFTVLKVSKSTLEFIRFEGEIENKSNLNEVVSRLDSKTIKDAKNMNEMKPGERPDTIHLSNLPSRWFSSRQENGRGNDKPSEYVFKKVFEQFGEVRCVDIPMLDPYRSQMKAHISGLKTFSFGQELAFEGYIQYQEYVCFVKAMDALRGMKLLHKEGDKSFTASIKVDFDRTKHLSEASIRKRRLERERLMAKEQELEERERLAREEAEKEAEIIRKKEEEEEQLKARLAEERRQRKAERHQVRQLRRLKREEAQRMNYKIAVEERKLLIAQRKLESIRLLDELFERVKVIRLQETKKESINQPKESNPDNSEKEDMEKKERELRSKLMKKYKSMQELQLKGQQEKLRQTVENRGKVRSVLAPSDGKGKDASESDDSMSTSSSSEASEKESDRRTKTSGSKLDESGLDKCKNAAKAWFDPMNTPSATGLFPMDFHGGLMALQPPFGDRFPYPQGGSVSSPWSRWPRYPRGRGEFMMPNYYYGMSDDYYKYFSKLAAQGGRSRSHSHSRSRSHSGSRSRARYRRRSRSNSRSRRSRSKSRRSKSSRRSRSRNRSRRSRSRSRSKSITTPRGRDRSRSRSKSRKTESTSRSAASPQKSHSRLSSSSQKPAVTKAHTVSSRSRSNQRSLSSPKAKSSYRKRGVNTSQDDPKPLPLGEATEVLSANGGTKGSHVQSKVSDMSGSKKKKKKQKKEK